MLALAAAVAVVVSACGHGEREACYANAEATAAHRAFVECPGKWSDCVARPSIMSELSRTEKSCQ